MKKIGLILMSLMLLLVLSVGLVAPDLVVRMAESPVGTVEMWNEPHGTLVGPAEGGGSGGGG